MDQCNSANCRSFAVNLDPKRKLCDVCFYRVPLSELLAILHRDGGQHQEEFGTQQAAKDAINIAHKLITKDI